MQNIWLLMGDEQFYAPLHPASDDPARLSPADVPDGWSPHDNGVWRYWQHPDATFAEQGWKVHVSATPERLQQVLDPVARACFELGVTFKHLATRDAYLLLHQKHSNRVQAGKFCAAYAGSEDAARALMERLRTDLDGEVGVYVLTDRRYRDSKVVHYRYGSFVHRDKLLLDGTKQSMMLDAEGNAVPDERRPSFVLPAGMSDPFLPPPDPAAVPATPGPVVLGDRFEVQEVIRHSNGGGTYRALDRTTGARVFVKEARGHNGYADDWADARERLRHEHRMLVRIHQADPGLCPEPLAYLTQWEHDFLVTEHVPGVSMLSWAASHISLPMLDVSAERRAAYHEKVEEVLAKLRDALDRLHALGLRFGDLSHGNVLVRTVTSADADDADHADSADDADETIELRLIDFETAGELTEPPSKLGTLGYAPPQHMKEAGVDGDEYGYSALAMMLLFPLARPLQLDPVGRLELHRRDLEGNQPIPDRLWEQATRFYVPREAVAGLVAGAAPTVSTSPTDAASSDAASADASPTDASLTHVSPSDVSPARADAPADADAPARTGTPAIAEAPAASAIAEASAAPAAPAAAKGTRPTAGTPYRLPTVAELDDRPLDWLTRLGDGLAAGITAMARPGQPDWLYPPGPSGFSANTHCRAHGAAGVLFALHKWGAPIPEAHLVRFRDDALAAVPTLPPGLEAGTAGIAWTMAELGLLDEAEKLIGLAQAHPMLAESVLLGHGAAGVGMTRLRMAHATGDAAHRAAAVRIADGILADDLAAARDQARTPGLEEGLSGVALFLDQVAQETGERRYTEAALRLMHDELDKANDDGEDGLRFRDRNGGRVITYLSIGSAGVATVLSRLAAANSDERFAAALPRVLLSCRATSSVEPGLYTGVTSWAYALAEHAGHTNAAADRDVAVRVASSLIKYAVPFAGGLRLLGAFEPRFHCDLSSGSAGMLLGLARLLRGPDAGLLTVNPAVNPAAKPGADRTVNPAANAPVDPAAHPAGAPAPAVPARATATVAAERPAAAATPAESATVPVGAASV